MARHGTGRLDTADGEMYEGTWKLGRRHGTGGFFSCPGESDQLVWVHTVLAHAVELRAPRLSSQPAACSIVGISGCTRGSWVISHSLPHSLPRSCSGSTRLRRSTPSFSGVAGLGSCHLQLCPCARSHAQCTVRRQASAAVKSLGRRQAGLAATLRCAHAQCMSKRKRWAAAEAPWGAAGVCRLPNGDQYCGEWRDDVQHGPGTCTYAQGGKYRGQWHNGLRHGQGSCAYYNGDTYKGAACCTLNPQPGHLLPILHVAGNARVMSGVLPFFCL